VTGVADYNPQVSAEEIEELVARNHLKRAGARPPLADYTRELWGRRHFIIEFSKASNAVGYSRSFLGQAWQVLTPLLNAAVYYLIFGLLLKTNRGISNFIAFLVVGMFVFTFIQSSMLAGARSISANVGLTRVLHFPRAVLPTSATLIAFQQLLMSMIVMIPIVLLTGERPSLRWLLLIPALGLESLFCLGLAFIMARIGAKIPDTSQVLPFLIRTWMYVSGVFYSIDVFTAHMHNHLLRHVLNINPGAVYIELARNALIGEQQQMTAHIWWYALGWALVVVAFGYHFFWKAEEQYGRV
jgi:teichoic acid transport system permease protein